MKKLLSLLGAVAISGSGAATVAACGDENTNTKPELNPINLSSYGQSEKALIKSYINNALWAKTITDQKANETVLTDENTIKFSSEFIVSNLVGPNFLGLDGLLKLFNFSFEGTENTVIKKGNVFKLKITPKKQETGLTKNINIVKGELDLNIEITGKFNLTSLLYYNFVATAIYKSNSTTIDDQASVQNFLVKYGEAVMSLTQTQAETFVKKFTYTVDKKTTDKYVLNKEYATTIKAADKNIGITGIWNGQVSFGYEFSEKNITANLTGADLLKGITGSTANKFQLTLPNIEKLYSNAIKSIFEVINDFILNQTGPITSLSSFISLEDINFNYSSILNLLLALEINPDLNSIDLTSIKTIGFNFNPSSLSLGSLSGVNINIDWTS